MVCVSPVDTMYIWLVNKYVNSTIYSNFEQYCKHKKVFTKHYVNRSQIIGASTYFCMLRKCHLCLLSR